MISTYTGSCDGAGRTSVEVDGHPLELPADLRSAAATIFDWGYAGLGGPAQLSLAILAHHTADEARARRYCADFLRAAVRHLPRDWTLTTRDIDAALPRDPWALGHGSEIWGG